MPKYTDNNDHIEEAQEILGRIPSWTTRWGITVVFSLLSVIILGCCFIKYPERVTGTVTITTSNTPVDVVSKSEGNLELISVSNGDYVKEGDILGIIHTGADYTDILSADSCLSAIAGNPPEEVVFNNSIYRNFLMGDIQRDWTSFVLSCQKFRDYITRAVILKKKALLDEQLDKQKDYYQQLQCQFSTVLEDLKYEEKSFMRDSSLFKMNVISEQSYDDSFRRLLQTRNSVAAFKSQMMSIELSIIQLEQKIIELSLQGEEETISFVDDIRTCWDQTLASLSNWKLSYLLTAPINGKVSFVRKWDKGQFINVGEHYLTVVPEGIQSIIGIVKIPQSSFGKVHTGQKVNVKLAGYPYIEYGMLTGTIGYLSSVPEETTNNQSGPQYTAEIIFQDGMRTSYGKELRLIQKMDGTAEIITEERNLIMRFLNPIITLFKNGI